MNGEAGGYSQRCLAGDFMPDRLTHTDPRFPLDLSVFYFVPVK